MLIGIHISVWVGVGWFQNLEMDWGVILASSIIAIPAFFLTAALMAALGAMVTTNQEGQSLSMIFVILHIIPIYISWGYLNHPNSLWSIILSVLPFTSLLTVGMRNIFSYVPPWQVAASFIVQAFFAAGGIWLAGKAFRLGMLQYGKRLSWRSLVSLGKDKRGR
jgi:ABC-2 type transport system permease protein